MNANQKTILHSVIWELKKMYESEDLNTISSVIAIKQLLHDLEEQRVINLEEAYQLEVYLFGILGLVRSKD